MQALRGEGWLEAWTMCPSRKGHPVDLLCVHRAASHRGPLVLDLPTIRSCAYAKLEQVVEVLVRRIRGGRERDYARSMQSFHKSKPCTRF